MTWDIVRHEWQVMRADAVVTFATVILLVLAAIAIALGASRVADRHRATVALTEAAARTSAAIMEELRTAPMEEPGTLPRGAATADYVANERGTYVALPATPLLALAVGQTDVHPDHYKVTARLRESELTGDQLENPLVLLAGHLDLTFLILYLYPLLVLAASADLTASERQSGTLRMMAAQGAPLQRVIAAKVLARAALVAAIPIGLGAGALVATGVAWDAIARVAWWTVASVTYGAFWLGVAVVVNAWGRSAASNAVALAGIWLFLVVLIPSVGNLTTRLVYPVPSRVQFATAMRAATRDAMVEGSRALGRFLEDHPSGGLGVDGMRQYAKLQAARDATVARRAEPLRAAYQTQLARQRRVIARLQVVSPAILSLLTLTDIAGTGGLRHRNFQDQAAAFQSRWQTYFEPWLLEARPLTGDDLARVPTFHYADESTRAVVVRTAGPIAALAAASLALAVWGHAAYRRYDITGA